MSAFSSTRVFESPFLRRTETVNGAGAILGALIAGPFYYWRKQAPVEALLLFSAQLILFFLSNPNIGHGRVDTATPSFILWLGAAFLAPVLLPMCYRRKGWIEIARI